MSRLVDKVGELALYARLCEEYGAQGADERVRALEATVEETIRALRALPQDEAMRAAEPDDYRTILALREPTCAAPDPHIGREAYRDKLLGAMLARFAGCTLGAIVEDWPVARMAQWAQTCGDAFPPVDYWSRADMPEDRRLYKVSAKRSYTRGNLNGVPVDDDVTYTLLGLLIAERYGLDFTVRDVGGAWLAWLPVACTAEDIALENLKRGIPAEQAADVDNPFCQWIGADIRSDPWGYIAAGHPEKAAAMAYQDAYLSHRRNGIYGEMFLAAAQAAAFVARDAREALTLGLGQIPKDCALAKDVRWALATADELADWREARARVDARFPGMAAVHTNNNMCLMIFGLLLGGTDVTRVLGETVAMGLDNDCTAASAGSIVGALVGAQRIPPQWTRGFNNRVLSYLNDHPVFYLDDLVNRFERLHRML